MTEALRQTPTLGIPETLKARAIQDAAEAYPGWLDEFYVTKSELPVEPLPIPQVIFENQQQEVRSRGFVENIKNNFKVIGATLSEKIRVPKKVRRFAAGPLLSATVVLACNNPTGATQTEAPKNTSEATPAATQAITLPPSNQESSQPTAAPTPEPTPTLAPTPEPTEAPKPLTVASVLEMEPAKIESSKVWDAFVSAWNNIPQFKNDYPDINKEIKTQWDKCTGKVRVSPKTQLEAYQGFLIYFVKIRDENISSNMNHFAYEVFRGVYLYGETQGSSDLKNALKDYLIYIKENSTY